MVDRKKHYAKLRVMESCEFCNGKENFSFACKKCMKKIILIDKYRQSNIHVDFWNKDIETFKGHEAFKKFIINYVENIDKNYNEGLSWCFAGGVGRGKTFGACYVLKNAMAKGYDVYYDTMSGIVSSIREDGNRRELIKKDFLVIDEFDSRFLPQSQAGIDFISSSMEYVIRNRCQNLMPTILCTNEEDGEIQNGFGDIFKITFDSLRSRYIKTFFVGGKDLRKM